MPLVESVMKTDGATITFSGKHFFTSGYDGSASFASIWADQVTIVDSTTVTAKWTKGIPVIATKSSPKLKFTKKLACSTNQDETKCNANSECNWSSNTCSDKAAAAPAAPATCSSHGIESDCNNDSSCNWSNNQCSSKSAQCSAHSTDTDCSADSICSWANNACAVKPGRRMLAVEEADS